MKLAEARIGYAGYSPDLSAPGDRRRFCAYASARGLRFEVADMARDYDLVLVTHNGDIAGWTERKRRAGARLKFVFELADSYFTQTGFARRHLKGAARRALTIDSRLSLDFMRTVVDACAASDAVICSTDEQAADIRRYNLNAFTSFDWFGDDIGAPKNDYRRCEKLRLVWEGQSTTLANVQAIRDVLNDLGNRIELHVVTDPLVYRYLGRFLPHRSTNLLDGVECDVHFHPWERSNFSRHITAGDLAVIPIDGSDRFAAGKPENKLVMMWQLGMPVVTSDTPAYRRAMSGAGLDLTCKTDHDWRDMLERLISAPAEELERIGHQGKVFSERAYSFEEFLKRFDRAFQAAGFEV